MTIAAHRTRRGTQSVTAQDAHEIRESWRRGASRLALAKVFGCSYEVVGQILCGRTFVSPGMRIKRAKVTP